VALLRILKKIRRNINDYGLRITLNKGIARLVKLFYENRTYRIYVKYLDKHTDSSSADDGFVYKLINAADDHFIRQIEDMEEWLHDKVKNKLQQGSLCLVALDGTAVAGFNLVSLAEGCLPLIYFKKKLRPGTAWSEHITVHKDYRGRRLASTIRARMFEVLKKRGVRKFYGGAQVENIASLKLARRVGFVEFADMQYRKVLNRKSLHCRRYRA
jgi:GNAT superfamily N-acetyltransferase